MTNRISSLLAERSLTHEDVAKALGVTRQAVQRWCSGNAPTLKNLERLAEFLGVSIADLSGNSAVVPSAPRSAVEKGWVRVPQLDVFASCGGGAVPVLQGQIVKSVDLSEEFLRSLPGVASVRDNFEIITATGDSMEPTILRGSPCLIDKRQNTINAEGVFCIQAQNQIFIKRVSRNLDGSITLLSDNPFYPPQHIQQELLENATVIGRIVFAFNKKVL